MEEWEGYFKNLLGGIRNRVIWRERGERRTGEERDIDRGEVRRVIRRLKDGKTMGVDRVPNEVWKNGEGIEE